MRDLLVTTLTSNIKVYSLNSFNPIVEKKKMLFDMLKGKKIKVKLQLA